MFPFIAYIFTIHWAIGLINVVASVTEDVREIVTEYVGKYEFYHLFETPNLHWLSNRLDGNGYKICFMAEYFLPDINNLRPISCDYKIRVLEQQDFEKLYLPEWSNALCKDRKHLDLLGIGAYEDEKLNFFLHKEKWCAQENGAVGK